jgi:hypothetical protein
MAFVNVTFRLSFINVSLGTTLNMVDRPMDGHRHSDTIRNRMWRGTYLGQYVTEN